MAFRTAYLMIVVAVMCLLACCDTNVERFIPIEEPFTIWGQFDAHADTQWVRVVELPGSLEGCDERRIDARVNSIDQNTGEEREWHYQLKHFQSGTCGHLFWTDLRALYGHTYHLSVERSDGATSSVVVTIPTEATLTREVDWSASTDEVTIVGPRENLKSILVTYEAVTVPPVKPWPEGTSPPPVYLVPVTIPYDEFLIEKDFGWTATINLKDDVSLVQDVFAGSCLSPDLIMLRSVKIEALFADENWRQPSGIVDPEVLLEPGVYSNVGNGYGFFGAGYVEGVRWTPSIGDQRQLGYWVHDPPCMAGAVPDPNCLVREPCFADDQPWSIVGGGL